MNDGDLRALYALALMSAFWFAHRVSWRSRWANGLWAVGLVAGFTWLGVQSMHLTPGAWLLVWMAGVAGWWLSRRQKVATSP